MIDIAIIGGGPAGLAAGLYACRGGKSCTLFEEMFVGGQITKTSSIENYPAFEEGIDGFSLTEKMEKQAERFGLSIKYDVIDKVELDGDVKKLFSGEKVFEAKTVILCMGASARELGVARENDFIGLGISYCATCDGAFYRDKTVAVVGGGDTAVSDALYLSGFAQKVYIIHRRDTLRASATLQKSLFANEKIEFVPECVVDAIEGDERITGVDVKNVRTTETKTIAVDGIFVAIGVVPKSGLVEGIVDINEQGYIVTDTNMNTSVKGVYAAGDVRNTPLRQVVTAVADGAVAATCALEYLML